MRERRGHRGPSVFRLVELVLTFMKDETSLIAAKGKWILKAQTFPWGEGWELISAVDDIQGLGDISAIR